MFNFEGHSIAVMVCFPNAKINIGLYVTEKRADGYHDLETVFFPVPVYDALEIVPAPDGRTSIFLSGLEITGDVTGNLVWKAWEMIARQFPDDVSPVHIYLGKAIPMGAGMGGGSADGTFMLLLLNRYFDLGLSEERLAALALELGSDCPFFVYNRPQLASGRGELLEDIALGVDWSDYRLCLVCPGLHISTARAFAGITPRQPAFDLRNIGTLPLTSWKDRISNDFEESIFLHYPELAAIKTYLYNQGALYVSMTGTGSAFYGIFPRTCRPDAAMESWQYPVQWYDDLTIKN